ncbi:flagellar hook capping FlgD N-terminal domain-containing protein [Janthinobacterium agaricidamnosum]|uniref:Basal-body rod modification protein FlgD n=1 Tax=Janthinobacterium agaricidamnosum NBRC 102515 = DSM 9628 TaxID=1349767 RepID=W0V3U4_9BURK|nr:flagellar hook capping FlgD N-terminal domain-containing protein [Janthinobacterium agaricidamnosum]CDG82546.1 flagellar hook capping family protein [Janthinobacterium agaricidamnosum NBRC 102515 = DSM 9628]
MQTNLLNNNNNASNNNPNPSQNSATSDMFTKLLVAQIKNQDPLSPTDPAQFVNQLTQQAQMEALQNLATLTASNADALQNIQIIALGAQIGSEVMARTDTVKTSDAKISGSVTLAAASSKTTVTLKGSDDKEYKIELGKQEPGSVPFTIDPVALGLPPGTYKMTVSTSSSDKPTIDIAGKLNSVRLLASGGAVMNVSNLGDVTPDNITGFNGKKT